MKVNIGNYKSWTGPYQIADALCWWVPEDADEHGYKSKPQWVHSFGTWLSTDRQGKDSWLMRLCNWIQSKRHRRISVHIDAYDTWGLDSTLALIVLPMLKQLRATKHGSPYVDDADVPVPIRSTAPGARDRCEEAHDLDEHHFQRWDWVLDEMIWAFEQKVDDNAVDQFYDHGTSVPGENVMDAVKRVKIDHAGLEAWQARKTNGFRLFGKYYECLWD
jgi:hypothetical protein